MKKRRLEGAGKSRKDTLGVEGQEVRSPDPLELPSRPGPAFHPVLEAATFILAHGVQYSTAPEARPDLAHGRVHEREHARNAHRRRHEDGHPRHLLVRKLT